MLEMEWRCGVGEVILNYYYYYYHNYYLVHFIVTLPPSVCRLSRQCGILNILQPYRPPWSVTGIAILLLLHFIVRSDIGLYKYVYVYVRSSTHL
jgi:O-antigen/teichoic acid export membrane protein